MKRKSYKIRKTQPVGARSASGRKRDRTPERVMPCDGVLRKRETYGVAANDGDYCDAIGRAYIAGLLGSDERAKILVQAARRVAWQYWRIYRPEFGSPDSLARYQPQSASRQLEPSEERMLEKALNDSIKSVEKLDRPYRFGNPHRAAFDQLVIDTNPDHGPPWLDEIIFAHRQKREPDPRHMRALDCARKALEEIA